MYEYKVAIYKVKYAEDAMNTYAEDGWRVIAVTPDHNSGFVDVFYERLKRSMSYKFVPHSQKAEEVGSEGEVLTEIVRDDVPAVEEDKTEPDEKENNAGTAESGESKE